MSLFSELSRRNVFRTALLYVVWAWVVLEACGFVVSWWDLPGWVYRFVAALLLIGLPLALVFSWI
jgi:hypothetical protein